MRCIVFETKKYFKLSKALFLVIVSAHSSPNLVDLTEFIVSIFLKEFLEQPYRKRPELKQGLLVSAIEKGTVLDPYL